VEIKAGWARTWGSNAMNTMSSIAVDADNNVLVVTNLGGEGDLDPGPDEVKVQYNSFLSLSKYASCGDFLWGLSWYGNRGVTYMENGLATDGEGNIYISGTFAGKVDLDPGPDMSQHEALGESDIFLLKLNKDGIFIWGRTWGGDDNGGQSESAPGVAIDDSGGVYVTGKIFESADMDPGPGRVMQPDSSDIQQEFILPDGKTQTAKINVQQPTFLSKFTSDGDFQWSRAWGGDQPGEIPGAYDVAVDQSGYVYAVGGYSGMVADLDPGPGIIRGDAYSNGQFLNKFDSTGSLIWSRSWDDYGYIRVATQGSDRVLVSSYYNLKSFTPLGDMEWDKDWMFSTDNPDVAIFGTPDVAANSDGRIVVTGALVTTTDLDPGTATAEFSPSGGSDAYLLDFNAAGEFQWAQTWGSDSPGIPVDASGSMRYFAVDGAYSVAFGRNGSIYVGGTYIGTADLDLGPGVDNHTATSYYGMFLMKFPPDGNWSP